MTDEHELDPWRDRQYRHWTDRSMTIHLVHSRSGDVVALCGAADGLIQESPPPAPRLCATCERMYRLAARSAKFRVSA